MGKDKAAQIVFGFLIFLCIVIGLYFFLGPAGCIKIPQLNYNAKPAPDSQEQSTVVPGKQVNPADLSTNEKNVDSGDAGSQGSSGCTDGG